MKTFNGLGFLIIILAFLVIIGSVSELQAAQDLMSVWNQRVDPATHPGAQSRPVAPVTWQDQDNKVLIAGFRYVNQEKDPQGGYRINIEAYHNYLDIWRAHGFESVIIPHAYFAYANNFKEVIDEYDRRGSHIFAVAGPGGWTVDGWFTVPPGHGRIPDDAHSYALEKLGSRFHGWEYGENDDGYNINLARSLPEMPVTRKDAYRYFMGFNRRIADVLQNYVIAMCNTTWGPYLADMGCVRQFGAQLPNQMYCVPMWCSIMRGASKQYGLLWWPNIDTCHNVMGTSKNYDHPDKELQLAGNSVSLIYRTSYLSYMYGACAIQSAEPLQMNPNIKLSVDGKEFIGPSLSPLGQLAKDQLDFIRKHPDNGVMYTPVALIWDFYAGWSPSRKNNFKVWGNMPYEKGDHQIDMVFRMLLPDSQNAQYFFDERGFLPSTPCGDIFDVLLSNVPRYVLDQYNAAVVIGPTKIEGQLQDTLQDFIDRGGSVATTAAQLTEMSAEMFGVKLTGEKLEKEHYVQLLNGEYKPGKAIFKDINESHFTLHKLKVLAGTEVLASNWYGEPVVVRRKTRAGGELLLFASDYGLSNRVGGQLGSKGHNQQPVTPYLMLEHVKAFLKPWLRKWNIVEVAGPSIQYLTNLTNEPDRVIVTLCNNEGDIWEGYIRLKDANVVKAVNWITGKNEEPGRFVRVRIKPHDLVILELKADRPLVKFKKKEDMPTPTPDELKRISDEVLVDVARYSPERMFKMKLPLLSTQKAEPAGALYVNSWLFGDMDPAEWIPVVKELGFAGVEIRGTDLYRPGMKKLWEQLQKAGLRVGAVHAGIDLVPFNFGTLATDVDSVREPTLAWLERTMDVMAKAGITRLIVYPGSKRNYSYQEGLKHTGSQTLPSLKRLAVKSQKHNIDILVETIHNQEAYRSNDALLGLISRVDSPKVKAGLNIANVRLFGENPLANIEKLQKDEPLEYIHLSNYRPFPNGRSFNNYCPLTQGEIPMDIYRQIFKARQNKGLPVCIYMLTPDQPLESLRQVVSSLRK